MRRFATITFLLVLAVTFLPAAACAQLATQLLDYQRQYQPPMARFTVTSDPAGIPLFVAGAARSYGRYGETPTIILGNPKNLKIAAYREGRILWVPLDLSRTNTHVDASGYANHELSFEFNHDTTKEASVRDMQMLNLRE